MVCCSFHHQPQPPHQPPPHHQPGFALVVISKVPVRHPTVNIAVVVVEYEADDTRVMSTLSQLTICPVAPVYDHPLIL